jgi:hypothetical protein
MPLFLYRCPKTGYRVQGFVAEDTSVDSHIYEPVTCPVCNQIHHVNPHTGVVLGEKPNKAASPSRFVLAIDVGERPPVSAAATNAGDNPNVQPSDCSSA